MTVARAAEIASVLRSITKFDRLGGADSMFGRKHVFEEFLQEEHDAAGEGHANGAYSFHGMGQYGNIVCWVPTLKAMKRFLALGYTPEHLEEQASFYQSGPECRGGIDEGVMASIIRSALKCEQGFDYYFDQWVKADAKVKAEEAAKNEAVAKDG